jgi:hypothetical protein
MPRSILSASALTLAALAVAAGAYASLTSGPRMGPQITVKRPAFHGYYDGHKDTYLNTDVSSKAQARAMHINYAPVLKTVPLKAAPEIYLAEGKAAVGQLAVFGSEPGEASYSPIWKETIRDICCVAKAAATFDAMSSVLIAEQQPDLRGFLERHLADDGFEVIDDDSRPDLVLLGDASELDTFRDRIGNVPVIVIGDEESDAVDRVRAFARGCDDFVARA